MILQIPLLPLYDTRIIIIKVLIFALKIIFIKLMSLCIGSET